MPRREGALIRRADHAPARREVAADPVPAICVVPECDDIGARGKQAFGELRRDARTVRDVLPVDDARVGVELVAQLRKTLLDRPSPRGAEDVGEEENSQFRTSAAAGRTSTDTWLPASFVYFASA